MKICPKCGSKLHKAGFSITKNSKQIWRCGNKKCLATYSGDNTPPDQD